MDEKDEVICDSSGWCFKMPRLDSEIIERYGFGTWDLADWTWGTAYAIPYFYKHVSEFDVIDRAIWKLENFFRYWEWKLFLDNHRALSKIFSFIRGAIFKIGWWKATRGR